MKAIRCRDYGPPESMRLEDVEPPPLGSADLRIRVRAYAPVRLVFEIAPVNAPDIGVDLEADGIRAKLLQRVKHWPGRVTVLAAQCDFCAVPRP